MKQLVTKLVVIATVASASFAFAGWEKAGDSNTASFSGNGPAGFKIEGNTKDVDVKGDYKTVSVVINLTKLDTGIAMRNDHMRNKYIQVDTFPDVTLAIPAASLKLEDGKTNEGDGKGNFTLRGVTKEISFKYKATCKGGTCDVEGNAGVLLTDYGINIPSFAGVTMKPDIKVKANFQMKKN